MKYHDCLLYSPDETIVEILSHFVKVLKIEHKNQSLTETEAADPTSVSWGTSRLETG